MSEYRAESSRIDRSPEVAPMRLSAESQLGAVDTSALSAAASSSTDALVRGGTLPSLTLSESSANDHLTAREDGSLDAHVKAGDNLWRIAREALSQGHEDGYRPSDREVQAAVGVIVRDNQMQNPDLIHPGDVIHIPVELLQQRQAQDQTSQSVSATADSSAATQSDQAPPLQADQSAQAGDHPGYRMHGEVHNATRPFGNAVATSFEQLPQNVRRLLAESGYKIVVAGRASEYDPAVAGTSATESKGYFDAGKGALVMPEFHYNPRSGYVRNDNIPGTFKNAAGYAVDAALGNMSHSDEFKAAFDADVARMSESDRVRFANLLRNGDAGREATFAQIFGTINGSATDRDQTLTILREFSGVKAVMQARLAQLPS